MAESKREARRWHRLDNTANLFPVISSKKYANVYRMALNLSQPVDGELLQRALETVLPWFDAFRVQMRRGLFWHYLESNPQTPRVTEEDDYPCRYINPRENNQFLFRVTYYGNRINLEVFHVLTDGTGALRFFGALLGQYLMLAHPAAFTAEQKATRWFSEHATNTEDSYVENYTPTKKATFREGKGFMLRGEKLLLDEMNITHAHIKLAGLKALCKEKGVTVGQYLTACIGWGVYKYQMKGQGAKHPVNIFLPINLRPYFDSNTSLNFFTNVYISQLFDRPNISFDELLAATHAQFEDKVTKENILQRISYTVGSGYSKPIRAVPLPIKHVALRAIYESSAGTATLSFTNVGVVRLPDIFARYVTGAYVLLSVSPRNAFQAAALSYSDTLTLSFTSALRSTGLQREIIRKLSADGLDITVENNGVDYENL